MCHYKKHTLSPAASAVLALALLGPLPASADCFDDAAQYHTVNPWVLRAITAQESGFNPNVKHRPMRMARSIEVGRELIASTFLS